MRLWDDSALSAMRIRRSPTMLTTVDRAALAVLLSCLTLSFVLPGMAFGATASVTYLKSTTHPLGQWVSSGDAEFEWDLALDWQPRMLGSHDTPGTARGVALSGTIAYVADGSSGLQIIDISNPAAPTRLGTYDTPGTARGVALSGATAYVADDASGLQIIDISNPAAPTRLGSYDAPGYANGIAISGTTVYVAGSFAGLQIIDVSNPAAPSQLGIYRSPGLAIGIAISGTIACVAEDSAGFQVVDVSNSAAPANFGTYNTPGFARGVALSGTKAYVADDASGLQIIDVSDPAHPALLGVYDTPGFARGVALSGTKAYVADDASGLQIIDVSDPAHPALLGVYDTPGFARGVALSGTKAYVADDASGLQIIDVSDPAHPVLLGAYDTPGYAFDVAVSGTTVLVADAQSGLQIIDVSDPTHPVLLGVGGTAGFALGVEVADSIAYVADYGEGLQIFDISTPSAPSLLARYRVGSLANAVTISGTMAYVAYPNDSLYVLDISDPAAPKFVGVDSSFKSAYDVVVSGTMAYVVRGAAGLEVLDARVPEVGYSYAVTGSSSTVPDAISEGARSCASISGLSDSVWYFHVRPTLDGVAQGTSHLGIRVDTTAPSTEASCTAGWSRSPVNVTLEPKDATSGVARTWYRIGSDSSSDYSDVFAVGAEGVTDITYGSVDRAGNLEEPKTATVRVDISPPTVSISPNDVVSERPATFALSAEDALSGVATIWRAIDGGVAEQTATVVLDTVGSHVIEYWARDLAGNESAHGLHSVRVDGPATSYVEIGGRSRYETTVAASRRAFPDGADSVVIATGENWPDALGGAALAAAKNGPILLTAPGALSSGIITEIRRLGATEAIVLGGTGAVSAAVEDALEAELGDPSVKRVWGTNRYKTAEAIARETIEELEAGSGYDGTAFVSTGRNFPDALAASPLAAAKGWPIFLSDPAGTPPTSAMKTLGVTDVLILGGTGVVSGAQETTLKGAFGAAHVDRLWGANRYETGVAVATYGVDRAGLAWDGLAMCTGQNFPDALAGGVLAGKNGSVMLLTDSKALPASVKSKLTVERDWIADVYYLGGTGAVSQGVRNEVAAILH